MDRINICLYCDNNNIKQAGVLIASILDNAKSDDNLNLYILNKNLTEENQKELQTLNFIKNSLIKFIQLNGQNHSGDENFYCINLASILPEIDKIIYLNSNLVVNTSLSELFNIDLGSFVIAGVSDSKKNKKRKNESSYINTDMLLMDLSKIRFQNIERSFTDYINKNKTQKINEQQIINDVLQGKIKLLNPKWNLQSQDFTTRSLYTKYPWIINYSGKEKPWQIGNYNYYNEYYYKYLNLTPWALNSKEVRALLIKSKLISLVRYFVSNPFFMFRPDFYKALKETYFTPEPEIYPDTFLVWEPCSKSHSEVVPGFVKYLLDLGYSVSVLVTPERLKEGLFSRFQDNRIFLNNLTQKQIKHFFKTHMLSDAKGILVTTVGKINNSLDYSDAHNYFRLKEGQKALFVEHEVCHSADNGTFDEKLITLRKLDYKGVNSVVVNPHYFGDIKITPKNRDITNFVTVGAIRAGKKNTGVIINAVKKLHENNIRNFKVTVIGKGTLDGIPHEIKKYFDIKGRLSFKEMYNEIEKADFFLTAYEKDKPAHIRYITSGTSGNFQLVYGFGIPCIIVEKFGPINCFDNTNSILYKDDEDYAAAMKIAIEMDEISYSQMQNNLLSYSKKLYHDSLRNLKELINE